METEAYLGPHDAASHARHGKTSRNFPMFGAPGRWYVYLAYGMYWMLNVVTGPGHSPSAVLVRGTNLVTGPGRLTRALRIDGSMNNTPLDRSSGLWIELSTDMPRRKINRTPRIGVDYAGAWARKPLRFVAREYI